MACLYEYRDEAAVAHLFSVAASLDSMVLGEPQILAQVKHAYQVATEQDNTGPLMHAVFQAALRVARWVASETNLHQRRISIPSVAVAEFARQIFDTSTTRRRSLSCRRDGRRDTPLFARKGRGGPRWSTGTVPGPRSWPRGGSGRALAWEGLPPALAAADLVISTTGAEQAMVGAAQLPRSRTGRKRPLLILDLAVPRDFEPAIGDRPDVYLYSIDDLQAACSETPPSATRSFPPPRTLSNRRRPASWPKCTIA